MPKRPLPQIYCDEHIKPYVFEGFQAQGLKCIWIAKTKKYAKRDEKDYIEEIYREGKLFATGDLQFVEYVIDNNLRHAGIIEIPPKIDAETAEWVTELLADIIKVYIEEDGKHGLRNHIIHIVKDGFHVIDDKGEDTLFYSWEALERDLNTPE